MPVFTVYGPDKEPRMETSQVNCIYDKATLKNMADAGFKFKIDGKTKSVADVVRFKEEGINQEQPKKRAPGKLF